MWILNFVPEWIIVASIVIGFLGNLVGFFLRFVPFVLQYRIIIIFVSNIILISGVYTKGLIDNHEYWNAKLVDAEMRVLKAEKASADANAKIEYVYVDRIKKVTEFKYVIKDKIKEVEKVIDKQCTITPDSINILNGAARLSLGEE